MDVNLTDKGEQSEMLCPIKGFEKNLANFVIRRVQ